MVSAGWLCEEEVASSLRNASEVNGYLAKDGESATLATIMSGLSAGKLQPRLPLVNLVTCSQPIPNRNPEQMDLQEREQPRPLRRQPTPQQPFPIDALGSILAGATRAIVDRLMQM